MEQTILIITGFVCTAFALAYQTNEANKLYIESRDKSEENNANWIKYCKELERHNDIKEKELELESRKFLTALEITNKQHGEALKKLADS